MKQSIAAIAVTLVLVAGCGGERESDKPAERLDKPYADKVKAIEQQNQKRVEDQMKAVDEQTRGQRNEEDEEG